MIKQNLGSYVIFGGNQNCFETSDESTNLPWHFCQKHSCIDLDKIWGRVSFLSTLINWFTCSWMKILQEKQIFSLYILQNMNVQGNDLQFNTLIPVSHFHLWDNSLQNVTHCHCYETTVLTFYPLNTWSYYIFTLCYSHFGAQIVNREQLLNKTLKLLKKVMQLFKCEKHIFIARVTVLLELWLSLPCQCVSYMCEHT